MLGWRRQSRSIANGSRRLRPRANVRNSAFDHLPDGILIVDPKTGALLDANPTAERILALRRESLIGKPLDSLLSAMPPAWCDTDDCTLDLTPIVVEGETRWYDVRLLRMDGASPAHMVVLHDATAYRHGEQEAQEARESADEALRLRGEFVAVISHEIRTPMHALIGMTSLLLGTPLSEEQKEFVDTIRASGDSVLSIVNNVLDFSKIEAGQIDLEHLPFDVEPHIEHTLDLFAGDAAKKNIELAYLADADAPTRIYGDVTRFRQVLTNLVGNAVKFTEQGEVCVQVSTKAENGAGKLYVQVKDTGIGIPADRRDRLFHSFGQADASIARRYGGSGLGLVISRHLCEIMGGNIWVESTEGCGTTFHFTIAAPPAPLETTHTPSELAGRRVLVVDDHASTREMIRRMLVSLQIEASVADSGWAALEMIETARGFDAALVDLRMPGMDGETLVRRISAERSLPRPRLVMLLSLTDGPVRGRAAELGLAACLTKPLKRSQLRHTLADLFPSARTMPQPAQPDELAISLVEPLRLDVLLADDNLVGRRVTQAVLRRLGCDADLAGNGREVLSALEARRYDVVLMDVYMPEMDGLASTQQIRRQMPPEQQPYIIALTASAMAEDRERCIDAGMDDYLAKPVRINLLNEALRKASAATAATDYPAPDAPENYAPTKPVTP